MTDNGKILFIQYNTNTNQHNMHKWLEKYDFELLNESDILTCSIFNNFIIDLTFTTKKLNNMLINWEINEDKVTGSDHETILFSINIDSGNLVENPVYNNQYNFEKAD